MITWLASYPKSGNTWLRALLTNYQQDGESPVDINELQGGPIASARVWFDEWAGVEASLLSDDVITRLRPDIYRCMAREANQTGEALIMKTHDAWDLTDQDEPIFPLDVSAGAVYILRNPLDLVSSSAHHYGLGLPQAVDRICDPEHALARSLGGLADQLRQHLRDWSGHVQSWLDEADRAGMSVYLVRYEDLRAAPETVFGEVVRFIGLPFDAARLRKAVAFSDFSELQRQEEADGFRERSVNAPGPFFRRGQVGSWREELPPELVQRMVAAHGETMQRFGYLGEHGEPI
jgi:aryl sulfotransferase